MPAYPKLTSMKMDYPEAPSGKVFVGKYVPPFEEVHGGHGFHGILVEDCKSGKLQCHVCGEWFEQLHCHASAKHGLNANQYRARFGLLQSTGLKSKRLRLLHSKVMVELRKKNPQNNLKFAKKNKYAGNRKNKPKALESQNKYGVCNLQIIEKILTLKEELGRTPTLIDLSNRYGAGLMPILHERYGSYITLCRSIGIEPGVSNFNPKYSREYFIEKALSNEPSIRTYTFNENRALYKYFKGGIKEIKMVVEKIKGKNDGNK
jgi:hypothetical protein